jgi:maleylacetoacetate isomerase
MSSSSNVVLYSYWRSSCSWRVRLSLALKGIDYEYKAVNLLKSEQTDQSYVNLNPLQELPTLVIDGLTLTQSSLHFRSNRYSFVSFYP